MTETVPERRVFGTAVLLTLGYAAFFFVIQFFIYRIGLVQNFPDASTIQRWDSSWYKSVGFDGYSYSPTRQTTSGFFWLFPAVWSLLGCDALVISIVNILFLALGFGALAVIFRLPARVQLLWLSTPAVFFAFVPYAEALFFCLSCFCLLGIFRRRLWLASTMLFLMALTRATAVFVIPAFLAMEVMANSRREIIKSLLRGVWYFVLPSLLGLAAFVLIQYSATGVWFAYFKAQAECWKRVWATPVFPLFSSGGYLTFWLNALAVFVCLTAFIYVIVVLIGWIRKNAIQERLLTVSMAYLGVALLSTLFYSPQWSPGHTDVIGTFRYTMLSPFFFVFLHHFGQARDYKWYHYFVVVLYASSVWMAFGAYFHIREFLFFTVNTLFIIFYMLDSRRGAEWPGQLLLVANFLLQVSFFQQFLVGVSLVD
ncbi:MAG: hypothetical protein KF744_13760 [Taibaiella sp.]|nr:hypothetical protein [Taibaiella sp.]